MNYWTEISIELANQKAYLDELFAVYPTIPEGIRKIDNSVWNSIEISFNNKDNICIAEDIRLSSTGICLNNSCKRQANGECWTCSNCIFLKIGENMMRPTCGIGNKMNWNNSNECWIGS